MIYDVEEIIELISEYAEKHPLVEDLRGEYILQNDKAQEDAIQLVANIFDTIES